MKTYRPHFVVRVGLLLLVVGGVFFLMACGQNTTTCPKSCEAGEQKCAEDGVLLCTRLVETGCFVWSKLPCKAGESCSIVNGKHQCFPKTTPNPCSNLTAEKRCVGNNVYWFDNCGNQKALVIACTGAQTCSNGQCSSSNPCATPCKLGEKRCKGVEVQECVQGSACNVWKTSYACPKSQVCSQGSCQKPGACTNQCSPNQQKCSGNGVQRCTQQGQCYVWSQVYPCASGQVCANGRCQASSGCQNTCSEGQRRCAGNVVENCVKDTNQCTSWKTLISCASGQTCSNGQCQGGGSGCQSCTVGQYRCSGIAIQKCVQQGNCTQWSNVQNCPANSTCQQRSTQIGCACNSGYKPSGNTCIKDGSSGNPSGSCGMTAEEKQVLDLTNQERAKQGLSALKCNATLVKAAQDWSLKQCQVGRISHDNFSARLKATGLRYYGAAENVAMGQSTPAAVVRAWMNSSGHRRNIMNGSLTHLGVGVSRCKGSRPYWTQIFMRMP